MVKNAALYQYGYDTNLTADGSLLSIDKGFV